MSFDNLTLIDRANFYNSQFPKYAKQAPLVATERWLYGIWMIGNNYRSKQQYYGEYPPKFRDRVISLFPDIKVEETLDLFSGTVNEGSDTFDIHQHLNPTYCGDAHNLSSIIKKKYKLIIADPPYSQEDSDHYGTIMISRNKVIKECFNILEGGGFIAWLDQVYPMFLKSNGQKLVGTIGVIRSINHRVRCLFIFQKEISDKFK